MSDTSDKTNIYTGVKGGNFHNVIIEERKRVFISGVRDVDSFDENAVRAYGDLGEIIIKGEGLHIENLSVESGELLIDGKINSVEYFEETKSGKGILHKIFK